MKNGVLYICDILAGIMLTVWIVRKQNHVYSCACWLIPNARNQTVWI